MYCAYEGFLNRAQLHNWRKSSYDDEHTGDTIHIFAQKELRRNGVVVQDSRYFEPHDAFGFAQTANVCSTLESHVEAFFKPSGGTLSLFQKEAQPRRRAAPDQNSEDEYLRAQAPRAGPTSL